MYNIDDNGVCTVDLQALHDFLSQRNFGDVDIGESIVSFKLADGQATTTDHVLVERLNVLFQGLMDLDGEFHDAHDGDYC